MAHDGALLAEKYTPAVISAVKLDPTVPDVHADEQQGLNDHQIHSTTLDPNCTCIAERMVLFCRVGKARGRRNASLQNGSSGGTNVGVVLRNCEHALSGSHRQVPGCSLQVGACASQCAQCVSEHRVAAQSLHCGAGRRSEEGKQSPHESRNAAAHSHVRLRRCSNCCLSPDCAQCS